MCLFCNKKNLEIYQKQDCNLQSTKMAKNDSFFFQIMKVGSHQLGRLGITVKFSLEPVNIFFGRLPL
jgi:hypothetical protein